MSIGSFFATVGEVAKEVGATIKEGIGGFNPDKPTNCPDFSKIEAGGKTDFNPDKPTSCPDFSDVKGKSGGQGEIVHSVTGIKFEEKTVKAPDGRVVKDNFPLFTSKFDAQLPADKLKVSDRQQFSECNRQLQDAVKNNPDLKSQFITEQLKQIENGDKPSGYTWHHNEETGKMQLVDSTIHGKTGHTGGKSVWGGGSENR